MGNLADTQYIYTMFANIANDVALRESVAIHYEHGHPLEIVNTMKGMSKTPAFDPLKYPLIALFQDFEEKVSAERSTSVSVNLIIACLTRPEMVASQRLTCSFIPILYPLYTSLIVSIMKSGYFAGTGMKDFPHTKVDRMYWGKSGLYGNEGNIFGDWIDAIEIKDLQLTIIKKDCI